MTDFYVTEDEIEHSFTRWNSNLIGAIQGRHAGSVLPRSYGTPFYVNPFKNFLFLRCNNISILEISPDNEQFDLLKNHLMDKFEVERERVVAGQTIFTLKASIDPDDEFNWIELEMSGAPDFLVYRWEVFYQKQPFKVYRITMFAIALRLSNWRIGSDRRFPKNRRFSTREVGLWTASLAVLLALTQYLIQSVL